MNDLIRRADVMREMWKHANGKTVLGGQTYQSLTLEVALDAIAALPTVKMDAAAIIQNRIDAIVQEEGSWEPDTNVTNFPEWAETAIEELEGVLTLIQKGHTEPTEYERKVAQMKKDFPNGI